MNYKMKKFLILEGLKKHLKLVVGTARFELATYRFIPLQFSLPDLKARLESGLYLRQ